MNNQKALLTKVMENEVTIGPKMNLKRPTLIIKEEWDRFSWGKTHVLMEIATYFLLNGNEENITYYGINEIYGKKFLNLVSEKLENLNISQYKKLKSEIRYKTNQLRVVGHMDPNRGYSNSIYLIDDLPLENQISKQLETRVLDGQIYVQLCRKYLIK
jgi:hypothetical protein